MLVWITVAMVGARSFAMAVNRLVDAAIDARNPRTAGRELPAGRLSRGQVIVFALASLAVFAVGVSQLAPITRWLAPLVIVPMVIYPYLKRFTPLCHLWLGVVDGLAPVGGWVAVTGHFDLAAWLLGAAVACWIAGFDIIYATMDIEVDRAQGLHSMPADYGIARALQISRALHALSVVALAGVGCSLGLGPVYAIGVVAVAAAARLRAAARLADRSLARRHGVPERQRRDRHCSTSARSRSTSHSRDRAAARAARRRARLRRPRRARRRRLACSSRAARSALLGPERQRQVDAAALHRRACCARAPGTCSWTGRRAASCRRRSARASPTRATGRCSGAGSARARTSCCAAGLYGLGAETAEAALAAAGLAEAAERPAAALSQGQRQRLALARALLPAPELLVLDEPHSGLDEASSARLDALLADARGSVTIVLATHERVAAELLCDELLHLEVLRVSAPAVPFARAVQPARAHRPRARAPRPAARARDGAVRRRGAGRAALRRRHRRSPPVALTVGSLWVTLLLATLLAVARVFNAERDEGLLDALVLAPIPRTAIWAAKAIAIAALLVLMEVVAVPLSYLFLPADAPVPRFGTLLLALLAGNIGLAALGSLVAAVASAVRGREVMVPLLFLPAAVPLLIAALACSVHAADGRERRATPGAGAALRCHRRPARIRRVRARPDRLIPWVFTTASCARRCSPPGASSSSPRC